MKKQTKKKLLLGAFAATVIAAGSAEIVGARQIGELINFRVTSNGNATSTLKKMNSTNTILNLMDTVGGKRVDVTNFNSNTGKSVGSAQVWTATRGSFYDNSVAGGSYYLKLFNKKLFQDNFTIYGLWSPDSN